MVGVEYERIKATNDSGMIISGFSGGARREGGMDPEQRVFMRQVCAVPTKPF